MLKAVIFDLDGTLYDYQAAHAAAWRALQDYARAHLSVEPERLDALHSRAFDLQKRRAGAPCAAIHDRLIRYQLMLELMGAPIGRAPEMQRDELLTLHRGRIEIPLLERLLM